MPEPLDLGAFKARCIYRSEVSGELEPEFDSREMLRCLVVIEALVEALQKMTASGTYAPGYVFHGYSHGWVLPPTHDIGASCLVCDALHLVKREPNASAP